MKDRVMIVGAYGRLGQILAHRLRDEGHPLVLVGRDKARLGDLSDFGHAAVCDIADGRAVDELFATQSQEVNVVVNASGSYLWKPFLEVSEEQWQNAIDVNLSGPFHLTQAFARYRKDKFGGGGSILHISSVHADIGDGASVPQCASKAGLEGLVKASAEALREQGTTVNAIRPGQIAHDNSDIMRDNPHGHVTNAEIAEMVLGFIKPHSRGLTGVLLPMYGSSRPVIGR